jgi:hypothetical protein
VKCCAALLRATSPVLSKWRKFRGLNVMESQKYEFVTSTFGGDQKATTAVTAMFCRE